MQNELEEERERLSELEAQLNVKGAEMETAREKWVA
jgi:hypothetical protein